MSRWARWTIGIAAILGGCATLLPEPRPKDPWGSAVIIAFFGLIAIACFSKTGRPLAARILGATISFAYFAFFYAKIHPYYSWKFGLGIFRWWDLPGLVLGFLLYFLPGMYAAFTGKFPWWLTRRSGKDENGPRGDQM